LTEISFRSPGRIQLNDVGGSSLCIIRAVQIRISHGQEGAIEGKGLLHEQSVFHRLVVLLTKKEHEAEPLIVPVGIMRVQLQLREAHGLCRFTKSGEKPGDRSTSASEGARVSAWQTRRQ